MSDVPTVESIQKLRVVDLRERLSKLGLPTSGLKADLVERLHSALVQKNEEQEDETKDAEKDEASGGFEEMQEDTASTQSESSQRDEGGSKDGSISKQPKEKSLLDKHKEALALEQVRLLEQEKAIQETVLLQQGQQQHQMLEEQRERQERLEEQKERAMARVQQKMIAREEEEKTMLAHQQHQMLEQQKILEEQQELMHLQQQALLEKTIELGGVPPPVPTSLAFTPVESAIVITPPAPIVSHPPSGVGMVTMAISGPPVNVVPPPPIIATASLAPPVPPVPAPVSMVPAGPPPVSMVSTIASIPSSVSMATSVSPAVSMVPTVAPVPPPVSMVPTSTPLPPPIQTSGPPMSMPMGIAPPPPMPMGGPPQPMTAPPQPPMSLTGPPQPPMPMPGPPQPPMSMSGPPQPPMSMPGPPQPPMSMPGPPQPPMSMGGPPQPPMSMPGPPPPPMSMPGPPQPPMSLGGPPQPPMSMGGPPQPPMPMGGPPQPPMPMGGPPQPPMSRGGPPQPPMNMPGPPPGGVPPPHMMQGPPSSGPSSMIPPPGPPSMTMGGMPSQHGPPAPNMQGPPPPMMQGPPPPIHGGPPRPMLQGPPTSMLQGSPHPGPMPPHHQGPQHPIHSGPPPMPHGPQPGGMHPGHPQGFHQRPPPPPPPLPPMHQNMPRGPPMVPPPPRPPTMMGMGNVGAPPPPPVRPRPPVRIESREPKEGEDKNEEGTGHIQLPQAIEKALQYKSQRAQQLGLEPDEVPQPGDEPDEDDDDDRNTGENREVRSSLPRKPLVAMDEGEDDDMEDEDQPHVPQKVRESKNVRRKKKKRARKNKLQQEKDQQPDKVEEVTIGPRNEEVEVLYVADKVESTDPFYYQFLHIFEKFKLKEADQNKEPELTEEERKERARQEEQALRLAERKKPADIDEKDDDDDEKKEEEKPKLSKRKLKKLNRMSIAELKQKVTRPELVEMHDVTAKDPVLLLHLKAARNSVPVPRHWCFKRKYLQGKRGIEKPPFDLPEFIKRTGIMEMRQALQEKEEQKTMKAKMRERVRPKMGKIDIDYQKLHDAFFKWQIKPRMTIHGDIYYEGKEFETRLKEKKPGDLSDDLRIALGMPIGQNSQKCPPPWLIAMQRYGPPPSYPNLKIPGLNAPIPEGCSFGYHAGGWGKPPVDESGRPLYGDVFGTQLTDLNGAGLEEEIDHSLWGELESESSEESEEESSEEEEKADDETGLVTPAEGLVTPSGLSSVPAGMETPDIIELRKRKIEAEMEGGDTPALYTILPEKQTEKVGGSMMGSTHVYDMSAAIQASRAKVSGAVAAMMPPDGVEVTLDPSELEMDSVAMAARYEQTVREQQSQLAKEDLSDMVAEHAARQKNKRKKQQQDSGKAAKKYKEFKF